MAGFSELIGNVLSRLAELLGIKPSESKRHDLLEAKTRSARANNVDRLDELKEDIRKLERRALRQKQEMEKATGDSKRIIISEIEQTFRDLDRLRGREKILMHNVDKLSVALAKIEELSAAKAQGLEEGELDDIALDLQVALDELKTTDRAKKDLERTEYEAPELHQVAAGQRLSALEGETEQPELSEKTMNRLKQLDMEIED